MSGYIELKRTGFGPFDDSLSLIEEAGDSYHHTRQWLEEGWNGEKPYINRINESIKFAANSYSDLIDALTALKTELREICAAIDDPACDLTLTTVECIKKLKAENEWQPIETAPKDGTVFLAWRKHATHPLMVRYEPSYDWFANYDGEHVYDLTHWMSLPKPPAMSQGE